MREIKFRAWIPKSYSGLSLMFYQNDQYLQSFLRRCVFFSNSEGKEHEKYGKYELILFWIETSISPYHPFLQFSYSPFQ